MGNGQHQILPTNGSPLPTVPVIEQKPSERDIPLRTDEPPKNLKENATLLFDQRWQNSQAAGLRNYLAAIISGGENHLSAAAATRAEVESFVQRQVEQAQNLFSQSWETLINTAREHADLRAFQDKPREFWDSVRQMSEVRLVESYVNGKLEPRVVSRYGELLEQFNRSGARMETFLASLPPGEREVFEARYQINQTFGANELFAGRGIALDENGQFPLRGFLAGNGNAIDLPLGSALGLGMANLSAEEIQLLLNSNFLFAAGSAALLSLNLALYQNAGAMLSLNDAAALEKFVLQRMAGEQFAATQLPFAQNVLENGKVYDAAARRAIENFIAGALISGALNVVEKYRKTSYQPIDVWMDDEREDSGFRFSAGATGAMMGATIGCAVPLAERNAGEILGFASSVVVGLSDGGLCSLGANALVSVITNGVQNYLNVSSVADQKSLAAASPNRFLNEAKSESIFEDDLRQRLFTRRMDAILTS